MAKIIDHKYSIDDAFRQCFYIVPDYQREYVVVGWGRAKLSHSNGYIKLKNRARFGAYIVVFTVKKRTILRSPWQERKGTIFRVTSGISRTDVINGYLL